MPDPEHVGILKQGVGTWNEWRNSQPTIRPDLRGANLRGANLRGANLTRADLSEANLIVADLHGADISGADLTGANLRRANLFWANLSGANLSEANLVVADLYETVFSNIDLRTTRGLAACVHHGPSTIDFRTLQRSSPLPLLFLRGVGLPNNLIDYLPSLLNHAIEFYSCFISYSSKDEAFAQRLHADLQDHGVRCWFAPEDLKIGDRFRAVTDESIRVYDKLLLILSARSVASAWVENEVETAFETEQRQNRTALFPVRLDSAVLKAETGWAADIRRTRQIGDFTKWRNHGTYQNAFDRLLRNLKAPPVKPAPWSIAANRPCRQ